MSDSVDTPAGAPADTPTGDAETLCATCKGTGLSTNKKRFCSKCLGSGKSEKRPYGWQ